MTPMTPYSCHIRVDENLHFVRPERHDRRGFSLVEVLVALTVLGIAATGLMAVGGAGRRLGEVAAVRTTQVLAARAALDAIAFGTASADTPFTGRRRLGVTVDTARIAPGLLELRVRVDGSGPAGTYETVTRRLEAGP